MKREISKSVAQTVCRKQGTLLLIISLFFTSVSHGQTDPLPNGTLTTQEYLTELEANLIDERLMPFDPENPDFNATLTLSVFLVMDVLGNPNFNTADLDVSISTLNGYFEPIGVQFKIGEIVEVPEYEYSYIAHRDSTKELEIKYARAENINLFLVDTIILGTTEYYGYTFFPSEPGRNFIFLQKNFILNNYLVTLMGNFFGLLFTHETLGGSELVNGANCSSAGDYTCDTYADPGLFGKVKDNCRYEGTSRDLEGEFYVPSVANLMSESPDTCKCFFSNEQYRRMKYTLFNLRDYLR